MSKYIIIGDMHVYGRLGYNKKEMVKLTCFEPVISDLVLPPALYLMERCYWSILNGILIRMRGLQILGCGNRDWLLPGVHKPHPM